MRFFPPERDFRSLSVRDLLEAREAYHVHLAHLPNVVATAIGLYRIRNEETNASRSDAASRYGEVQQARTLDNSSVRAWSWPAVLVFVDSWEPLESFSRKPDLAVPRRLYLPDGRVVPTCVIEAPRFPGGGPGVDRLAFSSSLLGGGYPVFTRDQGAEPFGSIGCLVTNGEAVFALTSRHVSGSEGREMLTLLHGRPRRVGVADGLSLGKLPFQRVYRGWPGARSFVNLDAGLIRVDDIGEWTAQVFGIGEVGELLDLHPDTVTLDLIGTPVRAFGGASGVLEGEVHALFFRYRSVGGAEFIADVLIGPRLGGTLATKPGDSGSVWFFDPPVGRRTARDAKGGGPARMEASEAIDAAEPAPEVGRVDAAPPVSEAAELKPDRGLRSRRLRPMAIQWGGERFTDSAGTPLQFALATFLSTVCRELDVDLVRDWNNGHPEYWGKIGHFKIGAAACDLVTTDGLLTLMRSNKPRIGFDDTDLELGREFRVGRGQYVPLADVADYIWVAAAHGRDPGGREFEGQQHFADMDQPGVGRFAGKTLLRLCADEANVSADVWKEFYEAFPEDERPEQGTLPFRVWQLYDESVAAVAAADVTRFVATAGALAHYVGDACQPLHVSQYHHGRGPAGGRHSPEWADYKKSPEYKIHAIYEQTMFEVAAVEMLGLINGHLSSPPALPQVEGGHAAAVEIVRLMAACHEALPPDAIIDADDPSLTQRERAQLLFEACGEKTAELVAKGCVALAGLWESAWAEGGGTALPADALAEIPEEEISRLVRDRNFLPALDLSSLLAGGFTASAGATR